MTAQPTRRQEKVEANRKQSVEAAKELAKVYNQVEVVKENIEDVAGVPTQFVNVVVRKESEVELSSFGEAADKLLSAKVKEHSANMVLTFVHELNGGDK